MTTTYQVSEEVWQQIQSEVARLTKRIQNEDELVPTDVAEVKRLVGMVNATAKAYNKALNEAYKTYKQRLDDQLTQIGYPVIVEYIAARKKEQSDAISQRLSEKLNTFHEIVQQSLAKTKWLKQTSFAGSIHNQMVNLFPKVMSGAKSKEINDWQPIEHMVNELIQYAEEQMQEVYTILPTQSHVTKTFEQYFATGDRTTLSHLMDDLQSDRAWIESHVLAKQMNSEKDVIRMIKQVADENDEQSLNRIQQIMHVWQNRSLYQN